MRHIRQGDENVHDHRFRCTAKYTNKLRPTICGAEPTARDYSRKDAEHVIVHFSVVKPGWVSEICPQCREACR